MPSPPRQSRYSNGSLLRSSTGAAIRRGDIKISDPIPHDHDTASAYRPNSDWPIKTAQVDTQRGRHYSTGDAIRNSMGPSLVTSSMSSIPSKDSAGQKKTTGFRATIRRMFGSKREQRPALDENRSYYPSDPGNLTAIARGPRTPDVARIPSQPAEGVTRSSALGSHGFNQNPSTTADEYTPAPTPAPSPPQHRRRNTLPSLVITDELAQILAEPKDDDLLAHARQQRKEPDLNHYRRRSRSADALNKMITEISTRTARDRESDIAYWRKSIVDNPLPSHLSWQEQSTDDVTPSTMSEADHSTKLAPLQTFDFGLDGRDGREASLEDRVNTLEVKMMDHEYAIASLQGHSRRPQPVPQPKAQVPRRRSIHDLFPDTTDSGMSSSSLEPRSFLSSPDNSPTVPNQPEQESEPPQQTYIPDRSSKATTIRPFTSHRRSQGSLPSPVRITVDQFDKLMDILRREASARRQLESQVDTLQKELEALRAPVFAEIREVDTPHKSGGIHETPSTNRTLRRSPPFVQKENTNTRRELEESRFSMSDLESEAESGYYDEVFETPRDGTFPFELQSRASPLVGVGVT